jgi:hypothetical protein
MSKLHERLPSDISERLALGIETAVSKGLRDELDTLKDMMSKYEVEPTPSPGDSSQEACQSEQSMTVCSPGQLQPGQYAGISPEPSTNFILEELARDQLVEMWSLKRSLSTITALESLPPATQRSKDQLVSSATPFSELKTTFAKWYVMRFSEGASC